MGRQVGVEYPERPLMAVLSDLLGIPHFTTSNGGTVRRDFLQAVAARLGADPEAETKDELIRQVWEAANGRPMPEGRLSPGGTVTNVVLQEIIDGVTRSGLAGPAEAAGGAGVLEREVDESIFDPSELADERTVRLVYRALREGQDSFRTAVLDAYGNRCAVTGTAAPQVLEAAHIAPYRGPRFNVVPNGVCLRADIHLLFDRGAIAVDTGSWSILVGEHVAASGYADLVGGSLRLPRAREDHPSTRALDAHREWARL